MPRRLNDITPEQVEKTCKLMETTNTAITYRSVALCMGFNRSAIANRPELREVVERYQAKRSQQIKIRRTEYNEAIADNGPPMKTWFDPSYATWNPALGRAIEEAERRKRKVASRWHDERA